MAPEPGRNLCLHSPITQFSIRTYPHYICILCRHQQEARENQEQHNICCKQTSKTFCQRRVVNVLTLVQDNQQHVCQRVLALCCHRVTMKRAFPVMLPPVSPCPVAQHYESGQDKPCMFERCTFGVEIEQQSVHLIQRLSHTHKGPHL